MKYDNNKDDDDDDDAFDDDNLVDYHDVGYAIDGAG